MEVTNNFKMYLPSEYINSNYTYNLDSQYIQIRTNQNCYTQYSTQYCDCFRVYPNYNFVKSNTYSCSLSNNYNATSEIFSSDIYNLPNISNYFVTYFIILFICVYVLKTMWHVFRKRLY